MTKRMLIDSTNAEETRVVVLDGSRLEDFDVETSTKRQLKGNIYLAKIVRVEPSLQAAFVEFGGGRHGFLAFGEIHPDYYQIPVADRKRLVEMQEAEAREQEEVEEREALRGRGGRAESEAEAEPARSQPEDAAAADAITEAGYAERAEPDETMPRPDQVAQPAAITQDIAVAPEEAQSLFAEPGDAPSPAGEPSLGADLAPEAAEPAPPEPMEEPPMIAESLAEHEQGALPAGGAAADEEDVETVHSAEPPEALGGESDAEDRGDRRETPRFLRNYKIQEVIRRRQILLVQVVKEERGTKGAALTTYISLAGRFSVLMPNSPRGGGISRKITSMADRRRLKEITAELDLPRGMGLIVRTAGANRPKPEIIRDCEYLLSQWDMIRDLTMKSMAPTLIYEEASLIKRAIRDLYSRDVDDILVDGEAGWKSAREFMRMLMPTHAKKVQLWTDPQPLFAKAQVEVQLDAMLQPSVQLRSGGYLVINQTEALVAIDVNSGRSTRERGIEETALRTNLEAAEETARQLRLRDLAGLVVVDFIDMESRRNNAAVEKRLKEALKSDRARIQVGSISHFGLLEMSRQRLRPSLAETSLMTCPHCGGSGHVRGTESSALHVLRGIEEEGGRRRSAEIVVHVAGSIALYILNHKRSRLGEIEARYDLQVTFNADDSLLPPEMRIERVRAQALSEAPAPISQLAPPEPFEDPDEEIVVDAPKAAETAEAADAASGAKADEEAEGSGETAEEGEQRRRRRRRRRRGGRREEDGLEAAPDEAAAVGDQAVDDLREPAAETPETPGTPTAETLETPAAGAVEAEGAAGAENADEGVAGEEGERKRRGRRGGRRRRRGEAAPAEDESGEDSQAPALQPAAFERQPEPSYSRPTYVGPTPADPFGGGNAFDFFDAVEQAEQAMVTRPVPIAAAPPPVAEKVAEPAMREPAAASEPEAVKAPAVVDAHSEALPQQQAAEADPAPGLEPDPAMEAMPEEAMPEPAAPGQSPETPLEERRETSRAVAPVLVGGADAPPVEKKRGWWRS